MSTIQKIPIHTETIRLGQFLKIAQIAATSGEAKMRIQAGEVRVNGEVETRRGRQLRPRDLVEVDNLRFQVTTPDG